MRSLFAALRYLVLPAGVTSGKRIVLDGVNGLILVYDENDDLIAYMAPDYGTEPGGKPYRMGMGVIPRNDTLSGDLLTAMALDAGGQLLFQYNPNSSADPFEEDGFISGYNPNADTDGAYLLFQAPTTNTQSDPFQMELRSRSKDGTEGFRLRVTPDSFASAANTNAAQIETCGFHRRITRAGSTDTPEVWTNAPLAANWTNLGEPIQYKLHPDGNVHLRGGANYNLGVPPNDTVVFTLPAGYRPPTNKLFTIAMWGGGFARIFMDTGGVTKIVAPTVNGPSFDGLSFSVIA